MEVVIDENHVGRFLAYVRSVLPHRDANVGSLQSHTVVDSIACHADDVSSVLKRLHYRELVLGCHSVEDTDAVDHLLKLRLTHLVDVVAADGLLVDRIQPDEMGCKTKVVTICQKVLSDVIDKRHRLSLSAKPAFRYEAVQAKFLFFASPFEIRLGANDVTGRYKNQCK